MTGRREGETTSNQRTHHVTSTDGAIIGGTVHGQGPPLVLSHGALGDGDLDWQALLPHLSDRFTCHLPSMRGRGLSGDHADLALDRRVDDLLAYVESIGEVTGLVGWSAGAYLALGAAVQADAVGSVALYEPVVARVMGEQERAVLGVTLARMGELTAADRWADAVRAFARFVFNDEEVAKLEDVGYFEAATRYAPNILNVHQQQRKHQRPTPDEPAVLGAISAPVLVLHGSNTKPFWTASAQHVAEHVHNARVQNIPGAGHAAPLTHPEALAEALTEFFLPAPR